VATEIARVMEHYRVIVMKSTVPTGTGSIVKRLVREKQQRPVEFDVVSNPEFLREGSAIHDFMRPDRIIIGCESPRAMQLMSDIYDPLYLLDVPIIKTDVRTSEMIKYASNAFLATKISFINEIANLCDRVGADVQVVSRAMGLDQRIGPKFLHAGAGFGGSCFPKDTQALCRTAEAAGCPLEIVSAVIRVNDRQQLVMVDKLEKMIGGVAGKRIGLLGLSFKPNTDDVRDAPALGIAVELRRRGAHVVGYDPVAAEIAGRAVADLEIAPDPYVLAEGCHALMLVTEWNQFRELDLARIRSVMAAPMLLDCRNVYDPQKVKELGFTYEGVGRR
jgi:UDPglucose 6-dehydrogenase